MKIEIKKEIKRKKSVIIIIVVVKKSQLKEREREREHTRTNIFNNKNNIKPCWEISVSIMLY
jgi:hypothetical protein